MFSFCSLIVRTYNLLFFHMFGFWKRSDEVRLQGIELRISALEARISSASDILEATERMDRVIKRSFRLKQQMDVLEGAKEPSAKNAAELSRSDILRLAK